MTESAQFRVETDTQGDIEVPADKLWGAQTQRSLQYFAIGDKALGPQTFPILFIHDFVLVKQAAARANLELGFLDSDKAGLIDRACVRVLSGEFDDQFPLSVWQTGSGTQTNMNVNEVLANIANTEAGTPLGSKSPVHPNDHVNLSQSSNDVFPTVMHVTAMRSLCESLLPAVNAFRVALGDKATEFADDIKIGRTHMMDATPVTLGQEFEAYRSQITFAGDQLGSCVNALATLAIGGTAVGTGLNSSPKWAQTVTFHISALSGYSFHEADNKFSQLAAHDALVTLHGHLNLLATTLYKIASDIRLMGSGPRCGLGEITIPANEPGSSIMPGKVNPTQVEAMTMVCVRVMANNSALTFANSQGHFQLNVYKPLIITTVLESLHLLADAMAGFQQHCLIGIKANSAQLQHNLEHSLMLVTALTPAIGYDKAAAVAKHAHAHNLGLKAAVVELQFMTEAEFDEWVKPDSMLGPNR